jgi:hypothetical protein
MRVKIFTTSFIINGEIDTLKDERLTDYIREKKDFIAVTSVLVSDRTEKELFRVPFMDVACRYIELIMPE